jgi:hypothetical protein
MPDSCAKILGKSDYHSLQNLSNNLAQTQVPVDSKESEMS